MRWGIGVCYNFCVRETAINMKQKRFEWQHGHLWRGNSSMPCYATAMVCLKTSDNRQGSFFLFNLNFMPACAPHFRRLFSHRFKFDKYGETHLRAITAKRAPLRVRLISAIIWIIPEISTEINLIGRVKFMTQLTKMNGNQKTYSGNMYGLHLS